MKNKPPFPRVAGRVMRAGFTMVEILAVIAVIAILMSVAAVGIQRMDAGQSTSTGLAVSEAVFDEARSAAVGRGARARVLIHNDSGPDNRDRYLRYLAVAVEVKTPSPGPGRPPRVEWVFLSRGVSLPSGVYYDQQATDAATATVPDIGTYGEMTIGLPGDKNNQVSCIYYEFNGEGICVDGGQHGDATGASPGAAFVLSGGILPPNETQVRVKGNNRTGFVVWRNGRSSIFRNPNHISP